MHLTILTAEPIDLNLFELNMRSVDRDEVVAVTGKGLHESMMMNIDGGKARVVYDPQAAGYRCVPLAIFGCQNMGERRGCPWMLGTVFLTPKVITQVTNEALPIWREEFDYLFNWVHSSNEVSKCWLERIGFTLRDPAPFGALGELFCKFEWSKPCATP